MKKKFVRIFASFLFVTVSVMLLLTITTLSLFWKNYIVVEVENEDGSQQRVMPKPQLVSKMEPSNPDSEENEYFKEDIPGRAHNSKSNQVFVEITDGVEKDNSPIDYEETDHLKIEDSEESDSDFSPCSKKYNPKKILAKLERVPDTLQNPHFSYVHAPLSELKRRADMGDGLAQRHYARILFNKYMDKRLDDESRDPLSDLELLRIFEEVYLNLVLSVKNNSAIGARHLSTYLSMHSHERYGTESIAWLLIASSMGSIDISFVYERALYRRWPSSNDLARATKLVPRLIAVFDLHDVVTPGDMEFPRKYVKDAEALAQYDSSGNPKEDGECISLKEILSGERQSFDAKNTNNTEFYQSKAKASYSEFMNIKKSGAYVWDKDVAYLLSEKFDNTFFYFLMAAKSGDVNSMLAISNLFSMDFPGRNQIKAKAWRHIYSNKAGSSATGSIDDGNAESVALLASLYSRAYGL